MEMRQNETYCTRCMRKTNIEAHISDYATITTRKRARTSRGRTTHVARDTGSRRQNNHPPNPGHEHTTSAPPSPTSLSPSFRRLPSSLLPPPRNTHTYSQHPLLALPSPFNRRVSWNTAVSCRRRQPPPKATLHDYPAAVLP